VSELKKSHFEQFTHEKIHKNAQFLTNFFQKIRREADEIHCCFICSQKDACFGFIFHIILAFLKFLGVI